jgi:hypothetical protein
LNFRIRVIRLMIIATSYLLCLRGTYTSSWPAARPAAGCEGYYVPVTSSGELEASNGPALSYGHWHGFADSDSDRRSRGQARRVTRRVPPSPAAAI